MRSPPTTWRQFTRLDIGQNRRERVLLSACYSGPMQLPCLESWRKNDVLDEVLPTVHPTMLNGHQKRQEARKAYIKRNRFGLAVVREGEFN